MKPVSAALLGAGARGMHDYGMHGFYHPDEIQFIAVAEPNEDRRHEFQKLHGISSDMCFADWRDLLARPRLADALLICTMDRMHVEPALAAIDRGYHILLEKPISPDPEECLTIVEKAANYDKVFMLGYVSRYAPFWSALKGLLDEGRIGRIVSVLHFEHVAYWHMAHSFVRGNWRNSDTSSPMILQKCCHDMDLLCWLIGSRCLRVASFGTLSHFKAENAPPGAPLRCTDGCPAEQTCPYYAPRLYLADELSWLASALGADLSTQGVLSALRDGPYGRCVYRCDNNVVDHQAVSMEFENGVTVAFEMGGFSYDNTRSVKYMGTKGEVKGYLSKNELIVTDFSTGKQDVIHIKAPAGGHEGADTLLMSDFVRQIRNGSGKGLTSAGTSLESHMMAFACEKSRLEGRTVELYDYIDEIVGKKDRLISRQV
jgi:predicted dehydrogenase